jgi:hypothetical protein
MEKEKLQEAELRNARTTRDSRTAGGQHRPPQGVSTFDDETPAERRERHRRAYAELGEPLPPELPPMREPAPFDPDSVPDAEPTQAPFTP